MLDRFGVRMWWCCDAVVLASGVVISLCCCIWVWVCWGVLVLGCCSVGILLWWNMLVCWCFDMLWHFGIMMLGCCCFGMWCCCVEMWYCCVGMWYCYVGVLVCWDVLVLGSSGVVVLWCWDIMALECCGVEMLWYCCVVLLGYAVIYPFPVTCHVGETRSPPSRQLAPPGHSGLAPFTGTNAGQSATTMAFKGRQSLYIFPTILPRHL